MNRFTHFMARRDAVGPGIAPASGAVRRAPRRTQLAREISIPKVNTTGGRGVHQNTRGRVWSPTLSAGLQLGVGLVLLAGAIPAGAAEQDLQLWFPVQVIHPITEKWALSMQVELRLQDDITEFSEFIVKPGLHYHLTPSWAFSAGYKYIHKRANKPDEQDPWQEVSYSKAFDKLVTGYQVRLEERLIDGANGILPRLRFLTHMSYPLSDGPWYLTGFAAVRFNLDDKGVGPVSGFEQSRIFGGLGRHIGRHVQFEFGYLWRYERKRVGSDLSDHAIHLQLVVNTRGKDYPVPHSRDRYR